MVKVFLASANQAQVCPYRQPLDDEPKKISSYTFGKGKHACLGVNLAISELTIFLKEFYPYMDRFKIDHEDEHVFSGMTIKSVKNIKLSRIL
jgi:cytochrome P450